MRKKKDIEVVIHKDIEKEMKRIADNIFGYNPKIDPRDPLFRKTLSWSVKKAGMRSPSFLYEYLIVFCVGNYILLYTITKIIKGHITMYPFIIQSFFSFFFPFPSYMSHELGEILPSMINISKSKIWDDWLQLTQYFPNRDSRYYEAAYVRYNAYDSPTEVYSGFGETEAESRAMLLFDLLEKKILTPDGLNLKEVDRRKEYENEFE